MIGACRGFCIAVGLAIAFASAPNSARAMQFSTLSLGDPQDSVVIAAVGPIIPGDMSRLASLIGTLSAQRIKGFALDSPGGNLLEAEKFANLVQKMSTTVGVLSGAKCVSACFLIFAAGASKVAAPDALIGVHSASEEGHETEDSMALTTFMAREAGDLGVPPAILGKMVEAKPGQMEWLTPDDLLSMGVRFLHPDLPETATAQPPPSASPPQKDALATAPTPSTQESAAFQAGLSDRRSWEQWFATITGDAHSGAEFWSAHRSDPKLPSCYGTNGQTLGDWTAGCIAAQRRLAASDIRRKTEPDYRRGWNSY